MAMKRSLAGWIGVDPGKTGAIAIVRPDMTAEVWGFKNRTGQEISGLFENLKAQGPVIACLEKVNAMPRQGVSSSFTFGKMAGFAEMALIAHQIPFRFVSPAKWQRKLDCLTKGDKKVSKHRASQLFPDVKLTLDIADALLIAYYAKISEEI